MNIKTSCVTTHGSTVNYFCFGSGKTPMVMLPGISTKDLMPLASAVKAAFAEFEEFFEIYVFERPDPLPSGCTIASIAEATGQAMDELGLRDACIYGVSTGGMIAQELAFQRRDLVKCIAFFSTGQKVIGEAADALRYSLELAAKGETKELAKQFGQLVYTPNFYEKYEQAIIDAFSGGTAKETDRFIQLSSAVLGFEGKGLPEGVDIPSVVVCGREDRIFSTTQAQELAQAFGSEPVIYDGYGHAVYDELAQAKLNALELFRKHCGG